MNDLNFDETVGLFYEAALEPQLWSKAMGAMAVFAETEQAAMSDSDYANGIIWRFVLHNIDEAVNREYVENFVAIDIRIPLILAHRGERMWSDVAGLDEETRTQHPLYRNYLKKHGITETLTSVVGTKGNRSGMLIFARTKPGHASEARHLVLARLIPHVSRALKISRRFVELAEYGRVGEAMLDGLPEPMAAVNRHGEIRVANAAFEHLLAKTDAIRLQGRKLLCTDAAAQHDLMNALTDAHALAYREPHASGGYPLTFTVPGPSGLRLQATVAPVLPTFGWQSSDGTGALLKLVDPTTPPHAAVLMQGYQLTLAEARLTCELVRGGALKELAARLDVSVNTVKTQLTAVYAKTGTRRRADLMAVLNNLPR